PEAIAVVQRCATDPTTPERTKLEVTLEADAVFGLDLAGVASEHTKAPREVLASVDEHRAARASRDWPRADLVRASFDGYRVEDHRNDKTIVSRADRRTGARDRRTISSAKELPDRRHEPTARWWSVALVTRDDADALERCVSATVRLLPRDAELLVLDAGSMPAAQDRLAYLAAGSRRIVAHFDDRDFGEGTSRCRSRSANGDTVRSRPVSIACVGTRTPFGNHFPKTSACGAAARTSIGCIAASTARSRRLAAPFSRQTGGCLGVSPSGLWSY